MTIHLLGYEFFRVVRQTDITKLLDALWKCFYPTYFTITGTFRDVEIAAKIYVVTVLY
jgi:hypothetical protein